MRREDAPFEGFGQSPLFFFFDDGDTNMHALINRQMEFNFEASARAVPLELRNAASNVVAFVNSGSKRLTNALAGEADRAIYDSIAHGYFESIGHKETP